MIRAVFSVLIVSSVLSYGPGGGGGRGGGGGGRRPGPPRPPGPPGPPGPHGPPPPPYLEDVDDDGRRAYFDIIRNNDTIAQQKTEIDKWAQTYGVSDEVTAYENKTTAMKTQIDQNITTFISQLSGAYSSLKGILDNDDQTREAQRKALEDYRKQNPEATKVIFFMAREFMPRPEFRDDRGGRGGMGDSGEMGGRGGNTGFSGGYEAGERGGSGMMRGRQEDGSGNF